MLFAFVQRLHRASGSHEIREYPLTALCIVACGGLFCRLLQVFCTNLGFACFNLTIASCWYAICISSTFAQSWKARNSTDGIMRRCMRRITLEARTAWVCAFFAQTWSMQSMERLNMQASGMEGLNMQTPCWCNKRTNLYEPAELSAAYNDA